MNTPVWDALLDVVDSFGTLVVLLAVIWAVGTKKLVPGWVYEECRAECPREKEGDP